MSRITILSLATGVLLAVAVVFYARQPQPAVAADAKPEATGAPIVAVKTATLSDPARIGETAFNAVCAACHGIHAAGRNGIGPPLIHKYYVPSHHGDFAFMAAVRNGVPSHHWRFGDMPPQKGLTDGDVKSIVTYIRELQRANGIF